MNDAIQKAQKFVDTMKAKGYKLTGASIFGSYAQGTSRADSDIDVCIISPDFSSDTIAEMVKLRMLAFPIDARIEPIPFLPDEMQNKTSALVSQIHAHNIQLVV